MQARRLPDGQEPKRPGEFAWMPYSLWEWKPSFFLGEGEWHLIDPTDGIGALGRHWIETKKDGSVIEHLPAHTWTIHADGTMTFSPSLVMPSGWHGFLCAGLLA